MTTRPRPISALGGLAAALLVTTGLTATSGASAVLPDPVVAAVPAAGGTPVALTPQPAYRGPAFEGWGTSLVWFANATGGYPDAIRLDLAEKLFSDDGLNLNIARYNIGGGNATDVPGDYFRQGGEVPGWWNPDFTATDDHGTVTTSYADRDRLLAAWSGEDPADYDLDADAGQRWWVVAIKDDVDTWEAFSNSPPFFMTESGYATGGFDPARDQIKPAAAGKFATYLKTAMQHVEQTSGISFDSVNPLNEPNTDYWGTFRNEDGSLKCCRQEGAHAGPALQSTLLTAMMDELARPGTTTTAVVSGPDETNPSTFVTDWNGWNPEVREGIGRLNVRTYGTSDRPAARDIAKTARTPLWMSEVEGNWGGNSFSPETMDNGIGLAGRITDDLRELESSAWVFWQPVEDFYNMQRVEKMNWGSIYVDFDCDADGNSARRVAAGEADPSCRVVVNSKYNTTRNFTHYIEPGDHIVPTNDRATTSAVKGDDSGVVLVHTNGSTADEDITVDLSRFGTFAADATVTPVVTTESPASDPTANALVAGTPIVVDHATRSATLSVPARSVTTFVVSGVSGIADTARPLENGERYQFVGAQSGKALTATMPGSAVATTISATATTSDTARVQTWTATKLTDGDTHDERFVFTAADGRVLTGTTAGTALSRLTPVAAATSPAAQWIPTTLDGETYSLVNVALTQALDVGGQATADGAPVGLYRSNGGSNQAFRLRAINPVGIVPVQRATSPGTPAALPGTVTPRYAWGGGPSVPVTWRTTGINWKKAGAVTVPGTATDVFGNDLPGVQAVVDIGVFTTTDPVSVDAFVGQPVASVSADAPGTVPARIGAGTRDHPAGTVWDLTPLTVESLSRPGVVTVRGRAASNQPGAPALPAILSVVVTPGTTENIAPDPGTTATATFTESGYDIAGTRDGVTTDKGWSNWVPDAKRSSDTLTYTFPTQLISTASIDFYRDGAALSWARTVGVEYRDAVSGAWIAAGDPILTDVPASGAPRADADLHGVRATGVRLVLTPNDASHITVSEVAIRAITPGPSPVAGAATIRVDGVPVAGFDPLVTEYRVPVTDGRPPVVSAIGIDRAASVVVHQPTAAKPKSTSTSTVIVTAEDGITTQVYRLTLVRVAPVGTVTTATPTTTRTVAGTPVSLRISVAARDGSRPRGVVTVLDGGRTVSTVDTGTANPGKVTVRLPVMTRGVHVLTAVFDGEVPYQWSRSLAVPVFVL